MENQKLIDQFHKRSTELVEVHITEFRNQEYVDVRIWTLPNPADSKDWQPTKKGVCINIDLLPRLIAALQKAEKHLAQGHESDAKERSVADEGDTPNEQPRRAGE